MTLNALTYQIYEALNITSDDTDIPERLIWDLIAQSRENAVKNEITKFRTPHTVFIQMLTCFPVEMVDDTFCCVLGFSTDCKMAKTVNPLPTPIATNSKPAIFSVGPSIASATRFSYVTYEQAIDSGNSRFTRTLVYAFVVNGYMYFVSKNQKLIVTLSKVDIHGIWANPVDLAPYMNCSGKPCFSPEKSEYPLTGGLWQTMVKPYVIQELAMKYQLPKDRMSNAEDDATKAGGQKIKGPGVPKEEAG